MKKTIIFLIILCNLISGCNFSVIENNEIPDREEKTTDMPQSSLINSSQDYNVTPTNIDINNDQKEKEEIEQFVVSNIINGGIAASDEEWIYYSSDTEGYEISDALLMKEKKNGQEKLVLCPDSPTCIQLVGDWVYFIDWSEKHTYEGGSICKIKKDGSGKTLIGTDVVSNMIVYDGWIYYICYNNDDREKIYKIKTDGTNRTKLNDNKSSNLFLSSDWLYYIEWNNRDDPSVFVSELFKMSINGKSKEKVLNVKTDRFIISNSSIFYVNKSDSNHLYVVNLNGDNNRIICSDNVKNLNSDGQVIYYIDEDNVMYRVQIDNGKTEIIRFSANLINIVDEWLYYYESFAEHDELRRMKKDGTEDMKVY